jgi:hypothetical protein
MATEKQIEANRRNAQRSTGPRTAAGKSFSSRNSFRHGLSIADGNNQETHTAIDALAVEIAGENPDAERFDAAMDAASAFFDIKQVCKIRQDMLKAARLSSATRKEWWRLLSVDRYEARARTKLRRATRRIRRQSNGSTS